jgi:hypothetical protein
MMVDSIDSTPGSGKFSRVGPCGPALVILNIIRGYGVFTYLMVTVYIEIARGYLTTRS